MTHLTLDQLELGNSATVTGLTGTVANRRNLVDLGILPGTQLQVESKGPLEIRLLFASERL
jgi:Fe2+ transport system protein FeoA